VHESTRDTWQWMVGGGRPSRMPGSPRAGMSPDREQELLAAIAGGHDV
jgi:hypothetical protein